MQEALRHARDMAPYESCGIIIGTEKNKKYIPCENLHKEKNGFKIDPLTFLKYQLTSNILYVVHSHYDQDCTPSQYDIDNCNEVGIPYMIVSYPGLETYILEPK